MRLEFAVSAAVAMFVVSGATASWAGKGSGRGNRTATRADKPAVPEAINRQFQWEEKVVGPKDGVNHEHIAAMQEQARREDAARKNDPPPRKAARAEGISAPASATLPTMDIEKPAPAASRKPARRAPAVAAYEPPRHRDAIDNLLADEGMKPSATATGRSGLNNVLAVDDKPAPAPRASMSKKSRKRHRRN